MSDQLLPKLVLKTKCFRLCKQKTEISIRECTFNEAVIEHEEFPEGDEMLYVLLLSSSHFLSEHILENHICARAALARVIRNEIL